MSEGFVLWFTGLSGAGKTTVAESVIEELKKYNIDYEYLDGDELREHLTKDLGFSKEDRDENIKRVGFVASLLSKHGVGVVSAFISPYQDMREHVRNISNNFIEVYVNASLEECEKRDVKGFYKKARAGDIKMFTGISDPYEPPQKPEIELNTGCETVEESTAKVIDYLKEKGFI